MSGERNVVRADVGLAIESARAEALRPSVIKQIVGGDLPADVGAALEARIGIMEVLGVQVGRVNGARIRHDNGLLVHATRTTIETADRRADLGVVKIVDR